VGAAQAGSRDDGREVRRSCDMSNLAVLIGDRAARVEDYLGPATVIEARGRSAVVELPDGPRVKARLALAFPYEPAQGDVLLVIGKGEEYYGIGVLEGEGRSILSFKGDVDVRAEGGTLSLSGDKGVEIRGEEVGVHAGQLKVVAGAVVQTFTSLFQRVTELMSSRSKRSHTIVDEASFTQAKSAAIVTEEDVTINGKHVHLG
jgi:hypothetical protein